MKKFLQSSTILAGLLFLPSLAHATGLEDCSPLQNGYIRDGFTPACGQLLKVNPDGSLNVTSTFSPSGTQDINLKQVGGVTTAVGSGVLGAGTQRVVLATDQPTVAVSNVAGSAIIGKVGIDQTTPGTTNGVVPDGVMDGVVKTSGAITSATTLLTFSAAELVGMQSIDFAFTAVGGGATVVVDQAGDGSTFNGVGTFWRTDAISSPTVSLGTPTTAMSFTVPVTATGMRVRLSLYTSGTYTLVATPKRGPALPPSLLQVGGTTTVADATALSSYSKVFAASGVYNGTSIDLWREAANGTNTTGTGIGSAAQLGQCDDVSQSATTENSFSNIRVSCTNHSLIIRPFETAANSWQATVTLTDTTNTAIHASCGAGLKNYVTSLDYSSVATTVADELDLNDNTTPIWKANIGAGAANRSMSWDTPKVGTAATAMNVAFTGSPTGAVIVNAGGFCAP